MRILNTLIKNSILVHKVFKIKDGYQSWSLIAATKIVHVMLSTILRQPILANIQKHFLFLVWLSMTNNNVNSVKVGLHAKIYNVS